MIFFNIFNLLKFFKIYKLVNTIYILNNNNKIFFNLNAYTFFFILLHCKKLSNIYFKKYY